MVDRQQLAEAWQDWLGPVALILVGLVLVGLRYFDILPDEPSAVALTGAVWGLGGLAVLGPAWKRLETPLRRWLGLAVVLVGAVTAAWVPWVAMGPGAVIADTSLTKPGEAWTGPTLTPGTYMLDVHTKPFATQATLDVRLGTGPGAKVLEGKFSTPTLNRRRAGTSGEERHRVSWKLPDEVFDKPLVVSAREQGKNHVRWPVRIVVRKGLPAWPPFVGIAVVLLILGALLDARSPRLRPTYIATYGAAAGAFGPLLASMYQPDHATRSVFFALFMGAFAGALVAAVLIRLIRSNASDEDASSPPSTLEPS